jgi:Zn finger protein HypA/HybF involved in hydrogenase expression
MVPSLSWACCQRKERRKLWVVPARISQEEWDRRAAESGIRWLERVATSSKPTRAICLICDEEFQPRPSNIHTGQGCPKCGRAKAGLQKRVGQSDWDKRARAVGVEWLEPVTTSKRKTQARCIECNYEWQIAPSKIGVGRACPKCGRIKAGISRRVKDEEWQRRAQVAGIEWLEPVQLKDTATPARCLTCAYEWRPSPKHVTQGHGCPQCAGVRAFTPDEWNAFADQLGLALLNSPKNQRARANLRCLTCEHEYTTGAGGLVAGHGCPSCAGVLPLPQSEWIKRATGAGYELLEDVTGGHVPTRAKCLKCGFEFNARPIETLRGTGCPACADYGFNPDLPSLVYLLRHRDDGALKIGIAKESPRKSSQSRLTSHRRHGWIPVRIWNFESGYAARDVEQMVLRWWRDDLGLPPAHIKGSGFTETVSGDRMTIRRVVRYVNKVLKTAS